MTDLDFNNTYNSTYEEEFVPYSERPETYIVPIIFALIFLVGVLGNGTLVLIFIKQKTMRNVPNTYILSLALGDLLVIITCVPFTSTVYTFSSWPYGLFVCKLSEIAKDISIGVSVFTLTALSADRFFAIVNPMRKLYSSIGGKGATGCTLMITAAIWLLAIVCATPAAVASYIRVFKDDSNATLFEICYPYPEEWGPLYPRTVVMAKFLVYYAIPLTIIGFFYILMAHHLVLSTQNMPGEIQGQVRQIKARKKVAKTVLAFVVVFALCFLPHHIFMLWFYNYPKAQMNYNKFWHLFRIIGFCLSFINSCINPIALYWVSGAFRKYFHKYLLCWRVQGRHTRNGRRCWESSTLAQLQPSTLRRQDTTGHQESTVLTTFTNGHQPLWRHQT